MVSTQTKTTIIENIKPDQAWGYSTAIDLYDCCPQTIKDRTKIAKFVEQLIDRIDMKAFGPCHIVHFGQDERVAGYSMFQLIETSCISAHFSNQSCAVYLDIFSCKTYDSHIAAHFAKDFFHAKSVRTQRLDRR